MRIEPAAEAQLPQIARLERLCFPDPWEEAVLRQWLRNFHVCLDGDTVTGYIVLQLIPGEGSIDNVAVDPARRRQGLGDALVRYAKELARAQGAAALYLEVRAGNEPALRLYKKHGFVPTGVRRRYYSHPTEDAVLMTAEL